MIIGVGDRSLPNVAAPWSEGRRLSVPRAPLVNACLGTGGVGVRGTTGAGRGWRRYLHRSRYIPCARSLFLAARWWARLSGWGSRHRWDGWSRGWFEGSFFWLYNNHPLAPWANLIGYTPIKPLDTFWVGMLRCTKTTWKHETCHKDRAYTYTKNIVATIVGQCPRGSDCAKQLV